MNFVVRLAKCYVSLVKLSQYKKFVLIYSTVFNISISKIIICQLFAKYVKIQFPLPFSTIEYCSFKCMLSMYFSGISLGNDEQIADIKDYFFRRGFYISAVFQSLCVCFKLCLVFISATLSPGFFLFIISDALHLQNLALNRSGSCSRLGT